MGGLPGAVLVALVEGQKPALLALQAGAELNLRIVHGEVNHTARELEKQLLRIAVMLILIDRIVHVLLGQLVFSSKVMTGRPLTKMHRSSDSLVASGEKWSWRVTLKMFFACSAAAAGLFTLGVI